MDEVGWHLAIESEHLKLRGQRASQAILIRRDQAGALGNVREHLITGPPRPLVQHSRLGGKPSAHQHGQSRIRKMKQILVSPRGEAKRVRLPLQRAANLGLTPRGIETSAENGGNQR